MLENVSAFPFPKLIYELYLIIDVMMHVDHQEAYKFMFSISKEIRRFFQNNFISIRNGFINNGLIPFEWKMTYDGCL
jgi:hypothetical protein